jgi:gamma-glutamylcyclotransferase (GGCT)/AIG2-like uncharacterized protein YtfP
MPLYFAYGSNLYLNQMKNRCPSSEVVQTARVFGWELGFCGYSDRWDGSVATLRESSEGITHGVLYKISEKDASTLDGYEGYPALYDRMNIEAHLDTGITQSCYTYILNRETGIPSSKYLYPIVKGYHHFDLPLEALSQILIRHGYVGSTVFVYGTLKKHEGNHAIMHGYHHMIGAMVEGNLFELEYGYPTLVLEKGKQAFGELYFYDQLQDVIPRLDDLEGCCHKDLEHNLYDRVITLASDEEGTEHPTWAYIAGAKLRDRLTDIGKLIERGIWASV